MFKHDAQSSFRLAGGLEGLKGFQSALRLCQGGMFMNPDAAVTAFDQSGPLPEVSAAE